MVNGPGVMVRPRPREPFRYLRCYSLEMYGGESVHELTNLIDGIANVRSGEREVLKGANNTTIFCCIRERSTIVCREL